MIINFHEIDISMTSEVKCLNGVLLRNRICRRIMGKEYIDKLRRTYQLTTPTYCQQIELSRTSLELVELRRALCRKMMLGILRK